MVGTPGVRIAGVFAVAVGCFVTLASNVRSPVIEVRSSESRDNRTRSDNPFRVVEFGLRVLLNRELAFVVEFLEDFTAWLADSRLVLPAPTDDDSLREKVVLVLNPVAIVLVGRL